MKIKDELKDEHDISFFVVAAIWGTGTIGFAANVEATPIVGVIVILSFGMAYAIYSRSWRKQNGDSDNPIPLVLGMSLLSNLMGLPVYFALSSIFS